MNADIEISKQRTLAVPEDAITEFEDISYVFIMTGRNSFKMQEVKTGSREFGLVEIINDESLKNARIVTGGAYTLLMSIKNIE